MEIKDFTENIKEQYDDAPESLTAESIFRDIEGYTSLTALLILSMIDEEYGVTLTGDDMRKVNTVGELFELVKSKQ